MYPKVLLQVAFCCKSLGTNVTGEDFIIMYLLVLLESFLSGVRSVLALFLFAKELAQIGVKFVVIMKFIGVSEHFLALLNVTLVFKSKVDHQVLVPATVTFEVLTTKSTVKALSGVVLRNMQVQYFVLRELLFTPVTGVRF